MAKRSVAAPLGTPVADDAGSTCGCLEPRAGRRRALRALSLAPLALAARPALAIAPSTVRSLSFYHTHTDERLRVTYHAGGAYLRDALTRIDAFLRDFRTGESHPIDQGLLDVLFSLSSILDGSVFEVISGYRSPVTNARLVASSAGVSKNSLHMEGRAIDVRLGGVDTRLLRAAAVELRAGGVGYYPESDFVHLDTGRPRTWGPA
ncbi:MAG TPA: DUF882 domain-containing protein [Burkholderiales bacterium]|nr:DUF882 domain-containing protein [Burkholderiales bacterium]